MYGTCSEPNFVGFEGSVDHTADMLYTWDEAGELTGTAVCIPCPSQVYELHCFLSADYWTDARDCIREELGNIFVLPLCGSAGDQNPLDLVRISKTNEKELAAWNAQAGEVFRNFDMALECRDIGERIAEAVVRGYGKARNRVETRPVLRHSVVRMELPIRRVAEDEYLASKKRVEEFLKNFTPERPLTDEDMVSMFEPCGDIVRYEEQQKSPTAPLEFHMLRVGRVAVAVNPFELFVEYAFRIRARAKAPQTFTVQLSNDLAGYLPTRAAVEGGSYSAKAASTLIGPDGGDIVVERTIEELDKLFAD